MLRANETTTRNRLNACSSFNDAIFHWLIDHVEGIIDEEKSVTHSQIANEINTVLSKQIEVVAEKYGLGVELFTLWEDPLI
jgi:hypothetical protein